MSLYYCYTECRNAEHHFAEYPYAKNRNAKCHDVQCDRALKHSAKCHYAECHGAYHGSKYSDLTNSFKCSI